jgi:Zn-dependent protease
MPFGQDWLLDRILILVPLWLSLSVHEWAHAWSAWKLGDDTAALSGRLTLNPLAHIDPIGTFLLPLMGIPFGWAKPVPVNPYRFTRKVRMHTGMMLTAIAGPISNLVLVAICTVLLAMVYRFDSAVGAAGPGAIKLLKMMICLNLILAIFNMLPIPPLDGSRVADALMPAAMRPGWTAFCNAGPFVLAAVIILPQLTGVSLFEWPVSVAEHLINSVIRLLAG